MKYEKIIIFVLSVMLVISIAFSVKCAAKVDFVGRLHSQYREQLYDATDINRRLAETVEQCKSISSRLSSCAESNIKNAGQAIEIIEEIRSEVGSLEKCLNLIDDSTYYQYCDDYIYEGGGK